ncbi:hypothetical protein KM043_010697 [Ampulex compressa]|nr:hypothetical protein KM043_010697 [Ampulex compressa]
MRVSRNIATRAARIPLQKGGRRTSECGATKATRKYTETKFYSAYKPNNDSITLASWIEDIQRQFTGAKPDKSQTSLFKISSPNSPTFDLDPAPSLLSTTLRPQPAPPATTLQNTQRIDNSVGHVRAFSAVTRRRNSRARTRAVEGVRRRLARRARVGGGREGAGGPSQAECRELAPSQADRLELASFLAAASRRLPGQDLASARHGASPESYASLVPSRCPRASSFLGPLLPRPPHGCEHLEGCSLPREFGGFSFEGGKREWGSCSLDSRCGKRRQVRREVRSVRAGGVGRGRQGLEEKVGAWRMGDDLEGEGRRCSSKAPVGPCEASTMRVSDTTALILWRVEPRAARTLFAFLCSSRAALAAAREEFSVCAFNRGIYGWVWGMVELERFEGDVGCGFF